MCENYLLSPLAEKKLLDILRLFELDTIFIDVILFTEYSEKIEIIGDHSLISESSEELNFWLHQLKLKDFTDINIGQMKGLVDTSKNRYDVIFKINNHLYLFVSKQRDQDKITETEAIQIEVLASDIAEIMLAQYV